jgi:hypothetical protein
MSSPPSRLADDGAGTRRQWCGKRERIGVQQ